MANCEFAVIISVFRHNNQPPHRRPTTIELALVVCAGGWFVGLGRMAARRGVATTATRRPDGASRIFYVLDGGAGATVPPRHTYSRRSRWALMAQPLLSAPSNGEMSTSPSSVGKGIGAVQQVTFAIAESTIASALSTPTGEQTPLVTRSVGPGTCLLRAAQDTRQRGRATS